MLKPVSKAKTHDVQEILDALSSSDIVEKIEIVVLVREPGRQALRATASLSEGYVLHINEASGRSFRRYSIPFRKENEWCGDGTIRPNGTGLKTCRITFIIAPLELFETPASSIRSALSYVSAATMKEHIVTVCITRTGTVYPFT